MNRARLDELIRAWLATMQRSTDADVAATASRALSLHRSLTSDGSRARAGDAAHYSALIERLMPSAARPSRIAEATDPRDGELPATDSHSFWTEVLKSLKAYVEADHPVAPESRDDVV